MSTIVPLPIKLYEKKYLKLHSIEDSITATELRDKVNENIKILSCMNEENINLNADSMIGRLFKYYLLLKE